MLHMKRKLMMAAAGVLAALMVFPAYGASRKPIKSISLTIKAEIKPDTDFGDELIEIETSSNKYSVDGYEILNDDVEWREDTVPRIQITLTANDDYYFQSLPKDKETIKGGAEFKNSKREDSSTTPADGCGAPGPEHLPSCFDKRGPHRGRHSHLGRHTGSGQL